MRVLLLSEGNTDVTLVLPDIVQGALRVFLRHLIEEAIGRGVSEWEIEGGRLPRLHRGHGYREKARLAIAIHSAHQQIESLAIVIDRDGPANSTRLRLLEEGRAAAEHDGYSLAIHTALGVAVEMIEAWLLADTNALENILGTEGAVPDPESCGNPKSRLNGLIDEAQISAPEAYDRLAQAAELQVIRQRCRAFERFAREIRHRVIPS